MMPNRASTNVLWRSCLPVGVCLLAGVGVVIGRVPASAAGATSIQIIPFSSECENTWKQLKVSIEHGTGAKVSLGTFSTAIPQYPNLLGFVQISSSGDVTPSDLKIYLDTAMARCYASASSRIPVNNPQLGRLLQLSIADIRNQTKAPIYVSLDKDQLVLHYNQPL